MMEQVFSDTTSVAANFLVERPLWFYLFVGFIGNLGHILAKLSKWETEEKDMTWNLFWKTSKFRTFLGVFLMVGAIMIFYAADELNFGVAFLSGYFCDSALRNSMKATGIGKGA